MDSTKVIWDLLEMNVIDEGNLRAITETKDTEQQNKMLHYYLKKKCTLEALKTVCKLIINMNGNPKMRVLGEDMMRRLEEAGVCVPNCMHVCLCVCVPCVGHTVHACLPTCMCAHMLA